jgi:hypothetical protein
MLLLLLIPCVEKLVGASSQWSSPALHLKFGCHWVEIQQTAAPRTEGPRSHGKWWVSGGRGDGKGDVEPSFDGTGSVVWECGRALCSLVSSIHSSLPPSFSLIPSHSSLLASLSLSLIHLNKRPIVFSCTLARSSPLLLTAHSPEQTH